MQTFSILKSSKRTDSAAEFETFFGIHPWHCKLHPRLLFNLPPKLLHLEISASLLKDPTIDNTRDTFATLFPSLKTLSICDSFDASSGISHIMDSLARELPSQLETLSLASRRMIPRLEQLPASLTNLRVCHPTIICALASYPESYPTLHLMSKLHAQTPNLTSLTTMLSYGPQIPFEDRPLRKEFEHWPILPHLTTLNLRAARGVQNSELASIIEFVPSVLSLGLYGLYSFGQTLEGTRSLLPDAPRTIRCVFPPHLTHLELVSTGFNLSMFTSLPPSLTSLALREAKLHGYEHRPGTTAPPSPWTLCIPRTIERLDAPSSVVLSIAELPPNLQTLSCNGFYSYRGPPKKAVKFGVKPEEPDALSWPPRLSSLTIREDLITKADVRTLPQTLTYLQCKLENSTDQDGAKAMLDHLPNCTIVSTASVTWITGPVKSSSTALKLTTAPGDATDGHFSPEAYARYCLKDLPNRFQATWSLSIGNAHGLKATVKLPESVQVAELLMEKRSIAHGIISPLVDPALPLLSQLPKLTELNEGRLEGHAIATLSATFAKFDCLTSISLPSFIGKLLSFHTLPRSLTSIEAGTAPSPLSTDYVHFDEWNAVFRKKPDSTGSGRKISMRGQEIEGFETQHRVSKLPRGLVRFRMPHIRIPPSCDGDWPSALTELDFASLEWEDRQIFSLPDRFNQRVEIHVSGLVSVYGLQRLTHADSMAQSNDFTFKVPSHDAIDLRTLGIAMEEQFRARNIWVKQFALPSIQVVASPNLHTLSLIPPDTPDLQVRLRKANEESRTPASHLKGIPYHPMVPYTVASTSDSLTSEFLASYPSLTTFSSHFELSWAQVLELPTTLRNISVCASNLVDTLIDPFSRFESLESLKIDSYGVHRVFLTSADALPPNLTSLECNILSFTPNLISTWPKKIATLLFLGADSWFDVDVLALSHRIGIDRLQSLSVSECLLTGALIPLHEAVQITLASLIQSTNLRLGEKVKVSWLRLAQPLAICALDLAPEEVRQGDWSQLQRSSLPIKPPACTLSLDLHLAPQPPLILSKAFCIPPCLTSLSIRTFAAISVEEASALPRTLLHFKHQIWSLTSLVPHPESWSRLPRGLESLTIELMTEANSAGEQPVQSKPLAYTITEKALLPAERLVKSREEEGRDPCRLDRMVGLPREKLSFISLRSFFLGPGCFEDFGTSLRELHCCDILCLDEEAQKRLTGLKILANVPGVLTPDYFPNGSSGSNDAGSERYPYAAHFSSLNGGRVPSELPKPVATRPQNPQRLYLF